MFEKWPECERARQTTGKRGTRERILAPQGAPVLTGKGLQSCQWCPGAQTAVSDRDAEQERLKEEEMFERRGKWRKSDGSEVEALTKCSVYPLPFTMLNVKIKSPRIMLLLGRWMCNSYHLWQCDINNWQFPGLYQGCITAVMGPKSSSSVYVPAGFC